MDIKDILSPDCTSCGVRGTSKKRILEIISEFANQNLSQVEVDAILASLMNREKVGSTGIGNGIAIPHGRLPHLDKIHALLVTCDAAIPYDAIDEQPVDIFFTLLVPEEQAEGHLQTLATVAQKLSDKDTIKRIRRAKTNQELFEAVA